MIFLNFLIVAVSSGGFVLHPAQAYTWNISPSIPQQCATVSVTVSNDSALPLDLLLIPYGPMPLSDASKKIHEIPFNGSDPYRIDFQLKYPAGTQLIPLVADKWGWSGAESGRNRGLIVSQNLDNDSPCWDSPTPKLPFTFSIYPDQLAQCQQTRIYWNVDEVRGGNPTFLSVVVGGGWFLINPGIISDIPGYGRGFIWRPPIRAGLDVIIVAGDIHGNATGGGMVMTVRPGTLFTNLTGDPLIGECPPANGTDLTYPVRDSNRTLNTGMVIGIVLAVVSTLVALAIFLLVKRRRRRRLNDAPTVTDDKHDERGVQGQGLPGGSNRQPSYYYLPELMTSPNPATQLQLESPLYYHPDTPSTGKGEVLMQPHSGIYTGLGTVLQRPWSATGSGMNGDTVTMSVASSSPTRGLIQTQAQYAAIDGGLDRRDYP